jgi:hypothetical protein
MATAEGNEKQDSGFNEQAAHSGFRMQKEF